jgi:heme/copper-type cytochrome/quinol oxidase subunit 1
VPKDKGKRVFLFFAKFAEIHKRVVSKRFQKISKFVEFVLWIYFIYFFVYPQVSYGANGIGRRGLYSVLRIGREIVPRENY